MQRAKAGKQVKAATKDAARSPDRFYKIGEVCAMTDTQPYVLRFWESEFPLLAPRKSRSGQRLYEKKDVDLVLKIKALLYDEEYTIAGARKRLEELGFSSGAEEQPSVPRKAAPTRSPARGGKEAPAQRMASLRRELLELKRLLDS
jgi:DNA-binding transcriptional MerR regulator